ncbi:hypothetical protein C5167_030114 [Papaver somniferum]|nr:hypothetical protein C5167_030114 [Papaver somniferum]
MELHTVSFSLIFPSFLTVRFGWEMINFQPLDFGRGYHTSNTLAPCDIPRAVVSKWKDGHLGV